MNIRISDYFEWQTVLLIAVCYACWIALVVYGGPIPVALWVFAMAIVTTLFWSIVHEVVHGHPTSNRWVNRLLVPFAIGWVFPYERFRDTHMQHHDTGKLTDPLDDPESWYMYAQDWNISGRILKAVLTFNNTLFGRMLIGPVISLTRFFAGEIRLLIRNKPMRAYLVGIWALHFLTCTMLGIFIHYFGSHSVWAYVAAAYFGLSFLLIRTYLEHQAVGNHQERTVIIEKNCPIACLFLFNNLHALHHEKPGIPWYRLPGIFRENRSELLKRNNHYVYSSYADIFRRYFFRPKEPVKHPLASR
ncbi:MAG: fatty acid desaturase [Rhizobiaceae bacterium]